MQLPNVGAKTVATAVFVPTLEDGFGGSGCGATPALAGCGYCLMMRPSTTADMGELAVMYSITTSSIG